MNFKKILIIYKKELLDLFRDRRTVITSLVLPIVLYPLLMIGFSSMMSRQEMKLEQQQMLIYLNDNILDETSIRIESELQNIENLQIMPKIDFYDETPLYELLKDKSIQAVVDLKDSLSSTGYQVLIAKIIYDETSERSSKTYRKISDKLFEIENELVGERLQEIKINEEILTAIELKKENIAPPAQMLGFALGKFLPYLLIILTISSAAVVSSDLVAGEKERKTLETILVSAARRNELVIGKYLTIITITIITVLLNLFSMYLSFHHIFSQYQTDAGGLQLPIGNFALILVLMIPLVTLFSALLLSISTYSRNIKEAQSYQMPVLFGGIMLSMVSFLPGFELSFGFALIPIVNFSLLIRNIMLGSFELSHLFIVVSSTIILDIIAIYISIRLFNCESVLFRTAEEKSLKFWGKDKKNVFTPQFGFLFFIVMLLALFYIGGKWQTENLINGLIRTELLIILLPTILILRISKSDIKKTLRLNQTNPLNFILIILLAFPILVLVGLLMQMINIIFPIPESYMESFNNLIQDITIWKSLFVIALLPGICEEVFFRGYIINVFRKQGIWKSIIITAVLFGIFHLDPFRMVPVTLLGIWMGYLLFKTNSILIPIFAHFANNSLALLIGRFADKMPYFEKILKDGEFPFWWGIPAILIFVFLLKIFAKINDKSCFNALELE
ncbi:MAG: CPBP family intramembrane metalloprotease [Armatimonadetes bacterium]|nr:CPBP family intramembrane metalloprotease [Armatimonadota bacterium]